MSAGNAGEVDINFIVPGMAKYMPDWATNFKRLGLNTLRLVGGQYQEPPINVWRSPNWETNLMNLLNIIESNDFKCFFDTMSTFAGEEWALEPVNDPNYINDYQMAQPGHAVTFDLTRAHQAIDKLAGNNNLGHNFLTDSRVTIFIILML